MINLEPLYIPMREARLSPNWGSKNHSTIMGVCPHHNDTPHPEPRRNNLNVKMIDGVILAKCKVCGELPDFLKFIGMNTVEPESICLQDITPVEPVIMDSPVIELPQVKQETSITELPIEAITVNTAAQSRVGIDDSIVGEYADDMKAGAIFPPMTVFFDDVNYWLAEGFHRIAAYRKAGIEVCPCIVKQGGLRAAQLLSFGSNKEHNAKRRTLADKRHAVELMLQDAEWSAWSDREIAKQCAVSHEWVRQIRLAMQASEVAICQPLTDAPSTVAEQVRTATRNGTTYQVKTANIGKVKPVAAKPEPETKPVILAMQPERESSAKLAVANKATVYKFPCEPVGSPYSPPGTHGFVMLRSSLLQNNISMMERYGIKGIVENLRDLLFRDGKRIDDDAQLPWNLFPDIKNPIGDPVKYFEMIADIPWKVIIQLIRLADSELADEVLSRLSGNESNEIDRFHSKFGSPESKESGADGKFTAGLTAESRDLFKHPPRFEVYGQLGHLPSQYHAFVCGNLHRAIDGIKTAIEYNGKMSEVSYPVEVIWPEGWEGERSNPFTSYEEYRDVFLKPIVYQSVQELTGLSGNNSTEIDKLKAELAYIKGMVREVYDGTATIRIYGDDDIAFDRN